VEELRERREARKLNRTDEKKMPGLEETVS
jgi:hypothetical protein